MALSYNVTSNKTLGRFIVASRDIKQGEIIIKEKPKLLGSQIAAFPICFKCSARLYTSSPPVCDQCSLAPICGQCSGTQHKQECPHMKQLCDDVKDMSVHFLSEHPQVCMPLRCLLMKHYDSAAWEEFLQLEAHLQERQGTYIYNLHKYQVEKPLREAGILKYLSVSEDNLVSTICGILDVNTFEVRPTQHFQGPEDCLRGLYLKPALMAHDCLSNTHLSVDDDFLMTIRASLPIQKGDTISFSYTNSLQGNMDRQKHLQEGKYFTCACIRCRDPTELTTGLSTLICPKCKRACLMYRNEQWQCTECNKTYDKRMILMTLSVAKEKVHEVLEVGSLQDAKQLVGTLQQTLHAQHGLIIEVIQKIITLLSMQPDIDSTLEKIDLCQKLSRVLAIIEPGISRHQGITQYELHNAKVHLGKAQYNASLVNIEQYLQILTEGEVILKGAISHLIYEPKSTPEGRLAQKALTDLQVLRGTIKDVRVKAQRKTRKHK